MSQVNQVTFHLADKFICAGSNWSVPDETRPGRPNSSGQVKNFLLQTRPVVPVRQMNRDVPDYTHIWVHLGSPGTSGATTFSRCAEGVPTDLMVEYYSQRSRTPGTLVITESVVIHPRAHGIPFLPGIWNKEQIAGWKKVCT